MIKLMNNTYSSRLFSKVSLKRCSRLPDHGSSSAVVVVALKSASSST